MRKVLIRTGISPFDIANTDYILKTDRVGGNPGNLLYQYSVYRTLMTDDVAFTSHYFPTDTADDALVERINSEYDCVVIPLANAFRESFQLKEVTAFLKRLRIPCVVIGCGVQADNLAQIDRGLPFDVDVKDFVRTVLDRSAMLGLRGEFTARYLQKLGFVPEKHFTVIGCPSLYTWGLDLPAPRPLELNRDTHISINIRHKQARTLNDLTARVMAEYPNYHMVFQMRAELTMLRYNVPIIDKPFLRGKAHPCYPHTQRHPIIREGRGIAFLNAHAWHEYMKQKDLSFGSRIHGNIAAVINGTPAFVFTTDTRTEELCRYHNIQFMPLQQLQPNADIRDICEQADFSAVLRGHEERFRHYVDFLNANSLPHIYQQSLRPENVPFDRAISGLPESEPLQYEPMTLRRYLQGAYAYGPLLSKVGQFVEIQAKKLLHRG